MNSNPLFLDLFAGAGGLSEGFVQAGFKPLAHVEIDTAACFTLKTRTAFHWLKETDQLNKYEDYLFQRIDRNTLYADIPEKILSTVINQEISKKTENALFTKIDSALGDRQLDLIVGGPPCQAYSIVGRSRKGGMLGDARNYLYVRYASFLQRYKPKYFVFENVLGLLSARDESGRLYFDLMCELFKQVGYAVEHRIISCNEYGIPQNRKRIILIGKQGKSDSFYPTPNKEILTATIADLFNDLPNIKSGEGTLKGTLYSKKGHKWLYENSIRHKNLPLTFHQARKNNAADLEIYAIAAKLWDKQKERLNYNDLPDRLKTHRQRENFLDRFKIVAGNLHFAHTVVAHIAKDGHYYIHPDVSQNRSLTPREAARIQTFPDDYFFENIKETLGRTAAYKQIGNAVPVLLAKKIAIKLKDQW